MGKGRWGDARKKKNQKRGNWPRRLTSISWHDMDLWTTKCTIVCLGRGGLVLGRPVAVSAALYVT